MRPYGTSEQLARRRARALTLLGDGHSPAQVAKRVGATSQSVCRWRRDAKRLEQPPQRVGLGRPSRLSDRQLRRLESALKRGACAYGYADDYWTLDRIAHVLWQLFGVRYRPSGVWYLLQRLGWSCQKPQRRALSRDEEAIAHWKRYVWPQIKKVA
ncbi:MAG: winged helix-turn-helix domain-containing protein [Chloroflexi bacterium]|nr:winged helix-turn-helix domain-containing protein [Chloroflexota bacterium]